MMRRYTALLAGMIVLAAAISGCMEQAPATTTTQAGPQMTQKTQTKVMVSQSALGAILVDARGMTLYAFMNDADGKSSCYQQCAQNWPPLTASGDLVAGEGLPGKLTSIERTDGTRQVAYNDIPLYLFSQDNAAGEAKGQGLKAIWYAINPLSGPLVPLTANGKPSATTLASSPTTLGDQSTGGAAPSGTLITKTSNVPDATSFDFNYKGDKAVLVNFGGDYKAYVNKCTHKGCAVSYNGDGTFVCPCHKSVFDAKTGQATTGPATGALSTIDVFVRGDSIYAK